ncbi:MAG: helix-hairpin-helix domain-containing protein [Propionibacteriaceae bacterium]
MEVFGDKRLPEVAEVVRARLAALFQPAVPAGERVAGPPGESPEPTWAAVAEHLRPDSGSPVPRLTSRHLAVVAGITLVAVVASAAWLLRAKAVPLAVAAPAPSPRPASAASPDPTTRSPTPSPAATPTILVHVLGAVASPGLVRLPQGARVADALAAVGGLRADADPAELNLAGILGDGSQVVVGTKAAPRGEVRQGSGTSGSAQSGTSGAEVIVDLNTATLTQLDALPGVGPVTAQAILDYRTKNRRFSSIEELQEVDGIGAKTYAQIAPHVRV